MDIESKLTYTYIVFSIWATYMTFRWESTQNEVRKKLRELENASKK